MRVVKRVVQFVVCERCLNKVIIVGLEVVFMSHFKYSSEIN